MGKKPSGFDKFFSPGLQRAMKAETKKKKPLTNKDGEVRELTAADFKNMRPAREVLKGPVFAPSTPYRPTLLKYLRDPKAAALYLEECRELGDEKLYKKALKNVADAKKKGRGDE